MQRHPYFDLLLHDDTELSELWQDEVLERVTLHEWPLSCVQRLTGLSGRKLIYKTEREPTVEPEFYAAAHSPLLATCQTIYQEGAHACMLLEYLEGPTLEELGLSELETAEVGRSLLSQINEIQGELPCRIDITLRVGWLDYANQVLEGLERLSSEGKFTQVSAETIARLEGWAGSERVNAAVEVEPGYLHHDLSGENIFLQPGGWKVIDWQRPMRGPIEVDLANLLESLGFDPLKHVPVEIVSILHFLRIGWFCECALRWFPAGSETYDRQIAELARHTGFA